jgi:alpha-beta hydrolase superfamily lysophospholipase
MVGDVKTLIKESSTNYPDLPQFLFGHSMGGGLVLHHGLTEETDLLAGYLASAPLIHVKRPLPGAVRATVKLLRKVWRNGTMPIPVAGKNISTIPEEQQRYNNDPLNHNRLGFGLAVGMVEAGERVLENASCWNKPLRLWHSRDDKITDFNASEKFASKATNCEFTAFDEVQHEIHQDVLREDVFELMARFIIEQC